MDKVWSRARAAIARQGIELFGIRIAEPHHDGRPHWHILVFVRPDQDESLISILRHYALQDSTHEPGARQRRYKVEKIDSAKGTAIGYVAKYITKNVDGFGVEADESGLETPKAAERVKAWSDRPNSYGEPIGEVVFGVQVGDVAIQTRIHIWRVEPIGFDSSCKSNFKILTCQAGDHLEYCQ